MARKAGADIQLRASLQDGISKKLTKIQQATVVHAKKVQATNKKMAKSSSDVSKQGKGQLSTGAKINAMLDQASKAGDKHAQQLSEVRLQKKMLIKQASAENLSMAEINRKYGRQIELLGQRESRIRRSIKQHNAETKAIEKKTRADAKNAAKSKKLAYQKSILGRANSAYSESLKAVTRNLKFMAVAAAAAAAALPAALMATSIKKAGEFEASMMRVGAVSGATANELAAVKDAVLQQAAVTEHTASETAHAAKTLAMAGMDSATVIESLPGVLQLASAGALEVGEASEIAAQMMAGYGMKASEMGRANDILVATSTNALVNVQEMGEAFKVAGPVAHTLGVEAEETAAAIGLLGDLGWRGGEAGTALRRSMARLINPVGEAKEALNEMGIKIRDGNNEFVGLSSIIRQLGPHAKDTQTLLKIFGQIAGPQMIALVGGGADAIDNLTNKIKASGGIAGDIAAKQLSTFEGMIKILKSMFESMQIGIGDAFLPLMKTIVLGLQDNFGAFKKWAAGITSVFAKVPNMLMSLIRPFHLLFRVALPSIAAEGVNVLMNVVNEFAKGFNGWMSFFGSDFRVGLMNAVDIGGVIKEGEKKAAEINDMYAELGLSFVNVTDKLDRIASGNENAAAKIDKHTEKVKKLNVALKDNLDLEGGDAAAEAAKARKKQAKEQKKLLEDAERRAEREMSNAKGVGDAFWSSYQTQKEANKLAREEGRATESAMKQGLKSSADQVIGFAEQKVMAMGAEAAAKVFSDNVMSLGVVGILTGSALAGVVLSAFRGLLKLNKGGLITDGQVGVDSVPALLSKGEMVLPKPIVDDILKLSGKHSPTTPARFNDGGIVSAPSVQQGGNVSMNISTLGLPNRAAARRWLRDVVAPELNTLKRTGQVRL